MRMEDGGRRRDAFEGVVKELPAGLEGGRKGGRMDGCRISLVRSSAGGGLLEAVVGKEWSGGLLWGRRGRQRVDLHLRLIGGRWGRKEHIPRPIHESFHPLAVVLHA